MGEYKDIEGQIARIERVYGALKFPQETQLVNRLIMGTSFDAVSAPGRDSFYARIGDLVEHRPTLAGALLAIELVLATKIDTEIEALTRLQDLRAMLKLPELPLGGGK